MKTNFFQKMGYAFVAMFLFSSVALGDNTETNSSQVPDKTPEGVEAVDLGLSVKWASCNLGATKMVEYGNYYGWGSIKKSNGNASMGPKIKSICGTKYDAARANWGGKWRMPSLAEMKELIDKCSWTYGSVDGVAGYTVTGTNGNCIFLPLAGYMDGVFGVGEEGEYWTGTADEEGQMMNFDSAYRLYISEGSVHCDGSTFHNEGACIRPVSK